MADPAPPPVKRYPGKRFTLGFLAIIATFFVASVLVNRRFEAITARFEILRQEWGHVAELLEIRFTEIDAAMQSDGGAAAESYRRLRSEYRKSSLYDEQSRLLARLWESYEVWRAQEVAAGSPDDSTERGSKPRTAIASSTADRERVQRFIEADKEAEALLGDPLGRITQSILLLDYPPRVYRTLRRILG